MGLILTGSQQWQETDGTPVAALELQSGYNFSAPETALTVKRAGIFDPPLSSNANQALFVRMSQNAPGSEWVAVFEASDATGALIGGTGFDLFTGAEDYYQPDSVGMPRIVADVSPSLADNATASWKGQYQLRVRDHDGIRVGFTLVSDGSAPMIGFLGAPAVGRQTLPVAATDAETTLALANSLRALAIALGLGA